MGDVTHWEITEVIDRQTGSQEPQSDLEWPLLLSLTGWTMSGLCPCFSREGVIISTLRP